MATTENIISYTQWSPMGNEQATTIPLLRLVLLAITILFFIAGCAPPAYTPKYAGQPVPRPVLAMMPLQASEAGVTVAADPYLQTQRQAAVLDADLNAAGALAIQIFVGNGGSHRLLVPSSELRGNEVTSFDITLMLPDGKEIVPVGPSTLALYFEKMPIAAKSTVIAPPTQNPRAYTVTILAQVMAQVATKAGSREGRMFAEKELEARRRDYRSKALPETALAPNETTHGFVYFILPTPVQSLAGSVLTIPLLDSDEGRSVRFRLKFDSTRNSSLQ
jgi:hypothetical protein